MREKPATVKQDGWSPRARVLGVLSQGTADRVPCFSGMGSVVRSALVELGYRFQDIHRDPDKMARAAASSYLLAQYECAVVPFDVCVEAEALGARVKFYDDPERFIHPTIEGRLISSVDDLSLIHVPDNLEEKGRLPVVGEAIRWLKREVGSEIPIGAHLLGPLTLAGRLLDIVTLYKLIIISPTRLIPLLHAMSQVVVRLAVFYREAGADYVCVREMGATTDLLTSESFATLVRPQLLHVFERIDYPAVLHICGSTNKIMKLMASCGAKAISVEAKNDLGRSRAEVGPGPVLFGNIDPVRVLAEGTPDTVEAAVLRCLEDGVDGVWPGCDISPETPLANLQAMVKTVARYGRSLWHRYRSATGANDRMAPGTRGTPGPSADVSCSSFVIQPEMMVATGMVVGPGAGFRR